MFAREYPGYKGYVNDLAGVISDQDEARLLSIIKGIERKTGAEVAILTIPTLDGESIEEYAVNLYERWGIGKKDIDNGVLLLLAMREREVRIEVGYGLEGVLTDGFCGEIIQRKIVPCFKEGRFGDGVISGTLAIVEAISKEYGISLDRSIGYRGKGPSLGEALLPILLLFFLLFGLRRGLFSLFMFGPDIGYWGSGRGGFGGGFGGFGGGLSGGGGATGRW